MTNPNNSYFTTGSNILPELEFIDQFKTTEGDIYQLGRYKNRYGRMQTRHYLYVNGEEITGISPQKFKGYKNELTTKESANNLS